MQKNNTLSLKLSALLLLFILLVTSPLLAQNRITSPKEHFGHNIGDDYFLATYTQMTEYWKKLASGEGRLAGSKMKWWSACRDAVDAGEHCGLENEDG